MTHVSGFGGHERRCPRSPFIPFWGPLLADVKAPVWLALLARSDRTDPWNDL